MNTFKSHECALCDRAFSRKYDLQRHERHVHPKEEEEGEEEDTDDSESEDEVSDRESSSSDELEDNEAYREWYEGAKDATEDMRREKYEKYVEEGMDPEMAREKAYLKTVWAVKRDFFDQYRTFLQSHAHLKDDDVFTEITDDLEEKMEKGVEVDEAVKRTMAKHRSKFDGMFQYDDDNNAEESATDEGGDD